MPIRIRHDAAAVALPSTNAANSKYGQSLVLQQQQQKYATQRDGYDRMFTLGRDAMQNREAAIRQGQQNAANTIRDVNQQVFQQQRDKALFDQQQQQQEAERQRAFMEEARKQSAGMIMDDIKNGNFDPATARKLQQNLVEESEALGNPALDATQRAEALQKIRAARALLSANRMQQPPPPTRDDQLKAFLGAGYEQYGNLPWVPDGKGGFSVSKEVLEQQQKELEQQQKELEQQQKMRPQSAQDYYGDPKNADKFQKDLDATMKSMQAEADLGKRKQDSVTQDAAWEQMQKDYEFRQKALGKPQYGDPSPAPALPSSADWSGGMLGGAPTPAAPGEQRSILEAPPAPQDLTVNAPDQGSPPMPSGGQSAQQAGDAAAYDADMTSKGYKLVTPSDGGRPYYYKDFTGAPSQEPSPKKGRLPLTANPSSLNPAATSPSQPQNPWAEVASGGQATPATPTQEPAQVPPADTAKPTPPAATAAAYAADMTSKGYKLVTPADGGRPYYYKDTTAGQQQNPWAEVASGGESAAQSPVSRDMALAPGHPNYKPMPTPTGQVDANGYVIMSDGSKLDPRDSAAMKSGGAQTQDVVRLTNPDGSPIEDDGSKKVTLEGLAQTPVVPPTSAQAGQPSLQVPKANFGELLSNATDDADRTVIGNLQGMYNSQPPEVQSAIDAFVNPGSTKVQRAEALLALREAGIDVRELAAQPKKPQNRKAKPDPGSELRSPPRGPKY